MGLWYLRGVETQHLAPMGVRVDREGYIFSPRVVASRCGWRIIESVQPGVLELRPGIKGRG